MDFQPRAEEAVTDASSANTPLAATLTDPDYSPAAVLHLFNNSLAVPQARRLIRCRGIYTPGRGTAYGGYYYDTLRDESSDAAMTLVVPGLLRQRLQPGTSILFHGFIARRVVATGGRIELHIHLESLLEQEAPRHTEEEIRALAIQQSKAAQGYRDVEACLKRRLVAGGAPRVVVVVGKTAIVDADILHAVGEAVAGFDIHFHRTSLHNPAAVCDALSEYDNEDTDLLVVARGGGEGVEHLNDCDLAEASTALTPHFATAIGHKTDVTLLQRVADRAFITPTAFGDFLRTLYNEVAAEAEHSRAALVESVKTQLAAGYEGQLHNLTEKLQAAEAVHAERTALLAARLEEREMELVLRTEAARALEEKLSAGTGWPQWAVVLVAALAGVVLGVSLAVVLR